MSKMIVKYLGNVCMQITNYGAVTTNYYDPCTQMTLLLIQLVVTLIRVNQKKLQGLN